MATSDFLPNSESENFLEEVKELREISKDLPYDFWVAMVGEMITKGLRPDLRKLVDGTRRRGQRSQKWLVNWVRQWTGEENRNGDLFEQIPLFVGWRDHARD